MAIGSSAGEGGDGSGPGIYTGAANSVFIGAQSGGTWVTGAIETTNQIAIGARARATKDNQMVLGSPGPTVPTLVEVVPGANNATTLGSASNAWKSFYLAATGGTNAIQVQAPATVASAYTLTLPGTAGTSNQVLTTNGSGTLSWTSPASGGVTSVTGTAPVVSSGGTTPAISMAAAASGVPGYLTAADWSTFSGKESALTFSSPLSRAIDTISLGTVGVANGGTGITTYATGDILYASAANTLGKLSAGSNGQVLTLAGGAPTWSALSLSSDASANTKGGGSALFALNGGAINTALGYSALSSVTTGSGNVGIGSTAGMAITGGDNVAVGSQTLWGGNGAVNSNIAIGTQTLRYASTGADNNVAVGIYALQGTSGTPVTGAGSVAIGRAAGSAVTSGSNNIFMGIEANTSAPTLSNQIALGAGAYASAANQLVMGGDGLLSWKPALTEVIPGANNSAALGSSSNAWKSFYLAATGGTNAIKLQAPATVASAYTLTLPDTDGNSNQVLTTDGNGVLSWTSPASGGVTSVSGTAPVVSSGGATPAISMAAAASGVPGYLTAADWATFNGKESALTFSAPLSRTTNTISLGTVGVGNGGTGTATAPSAAGGVIYAASTSAYGATGAGTSGQSLLSGGAGAPTWGTPATATTATNLAGGVAGAVHYQSAAGTSGFSAAGTSGQVLVSGGTGAPTWTTNISGSAANVTGTVSVANGGTGANTLTSGSYLVGNGTGAVTLKTPALVTADLSVLVGDSGSGGTKGLAPAPATGDAAAGKFLKADGTWATPAAGGGSVTSDANFNTGAGSLALVAPTGTNNTAFGYYALNAVSNTGATFGNSNTAFGANAGKTLITGTNDIAIGYNAGSSWATYAGNNIAIGNVGISSDSRVIRIGTQSTHTSAYMAGIRGVTVLAGDGLAVYVDSNNQLGTAASSIRYKQDVNDIGAISSRIYNLRPVTFHYKTNPTGTLQFGLIAEESDQVMPELTVRNSDGEIETVAYQFLPPMLLNEVQKQQRQLQAQKAENDQLRSDLDALKAELAEIKALLKK